MMISSKIENSTIGDILREVFSRLEGITVTPALDARNLLAFVMGKPAAWLRRRQGRLPWPCPASTAAATIFPRPA